MSSPITPLSRWCAEHDAGPTELADLTGYSVSYMSLIASGRREPPAPVKVAIARAIGVRVRDLWPRASREAASA
jgi:transcriptional regulator with XRE-family HTH domain